MKKFKFLVKDYVLHNIVEHISGEGVTWFNDDFSMIITTEEEARAQFEVTGICTTQEDWDNFDILLNQAKGIIPEE